MVSTLARTRLYLEKIIGAEGADLAKRISERRLPKDAKLLHLDRSIIDISLTERRKVLEEALLQEFPHLLAKKPINDDSQFVGNIENYIGLSSIPTGVMGPVRVMGSAANGDFMIPLATSEGALVASYHRGAKATRDSGGISSICISESVQRSPIFEFKDLGAVGSFLIWISEKERELSEIVSTQSRYAELLDIRPHIEGNRVILTFDYSTGDAAGQNMVTLCTEAICAYIVAQTPIKPEVWFLESNFSGDKKATAQSFMSVRGKKVSAEIVLTKEVIAKVLKSSPPQMCKYSTTASLASTQAGSIGAQAHYANGLTALFIACGQDVACIAESAVGVTRFEVTTGGDLYASVTLPNLIVGTVGGGTGLPTQRECLSMLGCVGTGTARKFAEICGAVVLCGELSIAAALAEGHFARAHKQLGRKTAE